MKLLNPTAQASVADAITQVEKKTDAELVTVLAPHADDYRWIGLLWAAVIALLLPGAVVFFPGWIDTRTLLLVQWVCFVVLGVIFQLPSITPRLVPRGVRHARASALARSQFLAQNLHRTAGATGMLIFVAEAERYVEILVDHGIASRLDDATWSTIVERFTGQVAAGQTEQGFIDCIQACGQYLTEALPATTARNQLPNRLVVLDG